MNRSTISNVLFHNFSDSHLIPLTPTQKSPMKEAQSAWTALPLTLPLGARLAPKMPLLIHLLNNELGGARLEKRREGRKRQPNVCMIIRVDNYRLEIPTHTILIQRSAKVGAPGLGILSLHLLFTSATAYLQHLATTWSIDFCRSLNSFVSLLQRKCFFVLEITTSAFRDLPGSTD